MTQGEEELHILVIERREIQIFEAPTDFLYRAFEVSAGVGKSVVFCGETNKGSEVGRGVKEI